MSRSMRIRSLAVVGLLLVTAVATACGSDGSGAAKETGQGSGQARASGGVEKGAFPVTIQHAFGSTTIKAAPKRVVSVGYTEQDALLALGVIPVGVTDWYGDQPYATWPWAQAKLGDAKPAVLSSTDGFQYERIAALKPDLIIGTNAGIEADTYKKLSAIAPTVAQHAGGQSYFSEWDEQTLMIGQAVGRPAAAKDLVNGVKAKFAAVAKAHPEWAGTKVVFLQNAIYDGNAIAYQDGLSTDFLTDLGFTIPKEIDAFATEGGQAYIPVEQLPVLDVADLLIWGTEKAADRKALEKEDLYNALEEVKDGHLLFTDGLTAGAIYFTSVLSLPFVLDELVPGLESTLAGKGPYTIDSY